MIFNESACGFEKECEDSPQGPYQIQIDLERGYDIVKM